MNQRTKTKLLAFISSTVLAFSAVDKIAETSLSRIPQVSQINQSSLFGGALVRLTPNQWSAEGLPAPTQDCQTPGQTNKIKLELVWWIHGTVGSTAVLNSALKAFRDEDLSNEASYKFVRTKIREQMKMHYSESPCYHEGLFRVNLNVQSYEDGYQELGLFPVLRAYQAFQDRKTIKTESKSQHSYPIHYCFGWSGLLSALERKKAAIALRNAIDYEYNSLLNHFRAKGYDPEITIQVNSHSHGGNVALLACAIEQKLSGGKILPLYKKLGYQNFCPEVSLENLLDKADNIAKIYPMDDWLFKPKAAMDREYLIDTLVAFGCPIQVETAALFGSDKLGRAWSLYSEGDIMQVIDMLTTATRKSWHSLTPALAKNLSAKLSQVEVAFPSRINVEGPAANFSVLRSFLGQGPSHLELWMISYSGNTERFCIRPLPLACTWPLLSGLLDPDVPNQQLVLSRQGNAVKFEVFSKEEQDYKSTHKETIGVPELEKISREILQKREFLTKQMEKDLPKLEKLYKKIRNFITKPLATS